jgi:hypothetical protein
MDSTTCQLHDHACCNSGAQHTAHGPAVDSPASRPARHDPAAQVSRAHAPANEPSLNRLAFSATLHCMTGCAIGEIAGLVIGTALGLGTLQTIGLAVALAFATGYLFTSLPLLRAGMPVARALKLALAADTLSILVMEIVDNALMLAIPGAMDAGLGDPLFWGSMAIALLIAGAAAYPLNRWLIARGQGHARVHAHHGHH